MLFTMVAVKGMLSMREEARAETHITKIMATAKRWSSGTAWEGREGEEQVSAMFITTQMQVANLEFKPNMQILFTDCNHRLYEASWRAPFTCPLPVSAQKRPSVVRALGSESKSNQD